MKRAFLSLPAILLILIGLAIIDGWGSGERINNFIKEHIIYPYKCEKELPVALEDALFSQCALDKYGLTRDQLNIVTDYRNGVCYVTIYVNNKLVSTFNVTFDKPFPIYCYQLQKAVQ